MTTTAQTATVAAVETKTSTTAPSTGEEKKTEGASAPSSSTTSPSVAAPVSSTPSVEAVTVPVPVVAPAESVPVAEVVVVAPTDHASETIPAMTGTSVTVVEQTVVEDYSDVVVLEPPFTMGSLTFNEDGSITDYYRYGLAIQAKVTVGDDYLVIDYIPATITGDDIQNFIEACASAFPGLVNDVTYEVSVDSIRFTFPPELMGGAFYKLTTLSFMNDVITGILDEANHSEAIYMSVDENEVKTFSTEFVLFGKKCSISAINTSAVINSDDPFTTEEMEMIVGVCLAVNQDLQYAEYSVDGNKMVVTYPEVSDIYIKNAVSSINNLIKAYTPEPLPMLEIFEPVAVADETTVAAEPVLEETSVTTEAPVAKVEETTTMPVVTIVEAPAVPVVAETKAGKKITYNTKLGVTMGAEQATDFGTLDFGLLVEGEAKLNEKLSVGLKTGITVANGIPFIPYVKGTFGNVYVQAGAGFTVAMQGDNRFKKILEASVGYEFPLEDAFSVFVEAGLRLTQYGSKTSIGGFGSVGGNIKF
ncbi:MAG: hypothetical protein KBS81_00355 [Spirochaetales bacterium]|nr:hypothetical protein [Candidatus Physcosoma equi]